MTAKAQRRLATAGAAGIIALDVATAVIALVLGDVTKAYGAVVVIAFPVVAAVIVRAQPRNGVGWVFLVASLCQCLNAVGEQTGALALRQHWPEWLAHLGYFLTITWFPALFLLITLGLLYFPNGRLPGRTWRWLERAAIVVMLLWTVPIGIAAWPVRAVTLASDSAPKVHGAAQVLFDLGSSMILLVVPCVLGCVASLILRWRRGGPIERLQIRWVAAAGIIAVLGELCVDLLPLAGVHFGDDGQTVVETTVFSLIAVATGVAVARYRLYEIDRIVSRTLSYAVVTLLLGATYVGVVALAAVVVPSDYGSIGVAAATLAVAALFVPLRRGIQGLVDHRFNRARYDATRVVDEFAAHIRGDLDQPELTAELLRTVQRAVAPASATIWVMPR